MERMGDHAIQTGNVELVAKCQRWQYLANQNDHCDWLPVAEKEGGTRLLTAGLLNLMLLKLLGVVAAVVRAVGRLVVARLEEKVGCGEGGGGKVLTGLGGKVTRNAAIGSAGDRVVVVDVLSSTFSSTLSFVSALLPLVATIRVSLNVSERSSIVPNCVWIR